MRSPGGIRSAKDTRGSRMRQAQGANGVTSNAKNAFNSGYLRLLHIQQYLSF